MKVNNSVMLLLALLAISCRQDPIFYIISKETAPVKPRIEGAPTNMVVFEREYPLDPYDRNNPFLVAPDDPDNHIVRIPILYVASGRLHWYAKSEKGMDASGWDSNEYQIDQPGGKIISLAVTPERLYALCMDDHGVNANLRYLESGTAQWQTISVSSDYPLIQSIYADPDTERLFAGARKDIKDRAMYAILYLDDIDNFQTLKEDAAVFSGAVCRAGIHYLCTKGNGIYTVSETSLADAVPDLSDPLTDMNGENVNVLMGIIKLEDSDSTIIAVERNGGALFKVGEDSLEPIYYGDDKIATGKYATGALALWQGFIYVNGETILKKLLVAGIQGGLYSSTVSSYSHGYVEFELNDDGSFTVDNYPLHDAGNLISVTDRDRYTSSIGKHPINHLFQAPMRIDDNMTFFAATQTEGLWSYRYRSDNGGWQWNAED
jgi:hypothetical protein